MAQTIGTNYTVTIPTLSDQASIIEAFRYFHTGRSDAGAPLTNSIEQHLINANTNITSLQTAIGWPYTNGSSISARVTSLEANSGSVGSFYVKTGPSSNTVANFSNIITPAAANIIPLVISGANAQSVDLQQWFVYGDSNARVKVTSAGKLMAYDATTGTVDDVVTISGTQSLTNKTVVSGVQTVTTQTATLALNYAGKFVNFTNTLAKTLTVPTNATVAFPIGTTITITNLAASGSLVVSAAVGVTLNSQDSRVTIFPYGTAFLFKVDTNTWTLNFMSKERTTFIQTTDPGAAAVDGDVWLKY